VGKRIDRTLINDDDRQEEHDALKGIEKHPAQICCNQHTDIVAELADLHLQQRLVDDPT